MKVEKLAPVGALLLAACLCTGCNKLKARDQLNKGVMAYRNAQFTEAIDHFQRAVRLDPALLNARLYLATALAEQYVPGGDTPDNLKTGQQAIDAFQQVLQIDPSNSNALGSIGQIYYETKNYDKAKEFQLRLMKTEPNNPDPYYWIGVLDWQPTYKNDMLLRQKLNLITPKDPAKPDVLPPLPAKAIDQLAAQNSALVDEGIQSLEKALQLKPDYADAMSYLNLMLRQKADLETSTDAREADLARADSLVSKALVLKKAAAAKAAAAPSSS
ncbi:MAG: tetratricopeptide repeat protein [Terriglobia bacterium]